MNETKITKSIQKMLSFQLISTVLSSAAMKQHPHYIHGQYFSSKNFWEFEMESLEGVLKKQQMSYLKSSDSEDQELLHQCLEGLALSFQQVQRGFFPLPERVAFLKRLQNEIHKDSENLSQIMAREIKKPLTLARLEIQRAQATLQATLDCADDFFKNHTFEKHKAQRLARGPLLAITPFNFPINLALHKIAPAILSGCPVLLKASPKAALSNLALVDLLHRAELPAGMLCSIQCDTELIQNIYQDARIATVSFTGSSSVGWKLAQELSKPLALELGGNAPVYVDPSADLKKAAQEIVLGSFAYAGQVCISVQNIYAPSQILHELQKELLLELEKFPTGSSLEEKNLCSELIDSSSFQRIKSLLKKEKEQGAEFLSASTEANPSLQNFVRPQFILNASTEFFKEEVFAPLASINPIADFESWIEKVNAQKNRLQCALFTKSPQQIQSAQNLDFGGIVVNKSPATRIDALPYGGQGASGLHREGPLYALEFLNTWKTFLNF